MEKAILPGSRFGRQAAASSTVEQVIAAQKRLAESHGCAYLDLYAAMGGARALTDWGRHPGAALAAMQERFDLKLDYRVVEQSKAEGFELYRNDAVHPTRVGYDLMAEIVFAIVTEEYEGYLKRR